jgi:pilus assembly protein CpaE
VRGKPTIHLGGDHDETTDDGDSHGTKRTFAVVVAVAVGDPKLRKLLLHALKDASLPVVEDNCEVTRLEDLTGTVERLRPDILFLGLPGLPSEPMLTISRLAALDPAPHIVVVNDSAEPDTILKTMRAGAAEFVYPPFNSPAFEESLQRVIADCANTMRDERSTGSMIGFVSAKGGCGATTLACHAASHLKRQTRKEVLLADFDMAAGITGTIMQTSARYSLEDALQNLHRMDLKLWKGLVSAAPSGVDVIPAPPEIASPTTPISRRLPPMLRFWRMHYDLTILDLGHGITQALLDVLDSIDTLVLVATNEVLALRQAKQMIQVLAARNFGANRLKLVINRMPKRTQIQLPELEKVMGHAIYAEIPNDYHRLNAAYSEPRLLEPSSELATQIGSFASRLAGLSEPDPKKPRKFFGLRSRK